MASSPDLVRVTHQDGVSTILFNRPDALNSVNLAMAQALAATAEALPGWDSRAIVLRGAGPAFMAGGDIPEMAKAADRAATVDELVSAAHRFSLALARAPQPTVAVIHGAAAGYGLSLAVSCDFTLCADDAKLSFSYRRLGASCDGGPSFVLPRLVGAARAADLLLRRDRIPVEEALRIGLIGETAPAAQLDARLGALLTSLLANAPQAAAEVKRLLRPPVEDFARALEAERLAFRALAATPQFAEGLAAFLEKREPDFRP